MSLLSIEQSMFGMLSALEKDAREIIRLYLEPQLGHNAILAPYNEKISKRVQKFDYISTDKIDYLDFADSFEIFNRNRNLLPRDLCDDLDGLRSNVAILTQIRNKVMHARPLESTDPGTLQQILNCLTTQWWEELHETKAAIEGGTAQIQIEVEPDESSVFHNLPSTDFNRTGLIGRSKEQGEIARLLKDDRVSVVTITGEGGVGKTALAQKVAYQFLDDKSPPPFEAIFWVTLKTERLTIDGIEQISNAIHNLPEAVIEMGRSLDESFDGRLETLAESLDGLRVLICIDNLETTTGEDFLRFYDRMPNGVKYLITSRRGIGQIERRYQLEPFSEKNALHYLHLLISAHRIEALAQSTLEVKKEIVARYGNNPLAIKWFTLSLAAGKTLNQVFENETDFLDFCIKSVISGISSVGRHAMLILSHSKSWMLTEEIVTASNLSSEEIYEGLRELSESALIRSTLISGDQIRQQYSLTEIAIKYVKVGDIFTEEELDAARKRLVRFEADQEDRRHDSKEEMFSHFSIEARDDSEAAVAFLLRKALRSSKKDANEGLRLVAQARELAPDYWEIDRVEAFIRHYFDDPLKVTNLYLSAISNAPNEREIARCQFWLAQHLARSGFLDEARLYGERAYDLLKSVEILHLLGNLKVRENDFEGAISDIARSVEGTTGKTKAVHATSYITAYKRWSEYLLNREKNPPKAFDALKSGLKIFDRYYSEGLRDFKMIDVYAELVLVGTWVVLRSKKLGTKDYNDSIASFLQLLKYPDIAFESSSFGKAIANFCQRERYHAQPLHDFLLNLDSMQIDSILRSTSKQLANLVKIGTIIQLRDQKYGFISHPDYPNNIFFTDRKLEDGLSMSDLYRGLKVAFSIDKARSSDSSRAAVAEFVRLEK